MAGSGMYIFSLAMPQLGLRSGDGEEVRETWKLSPGEARSARLGMTQASMSPCVPAPQPALSALALQLSFPLPVALSSAPRISQTAALMGLEWEEAGKRKCWLESEEG